LLTIDNRHSPLVYWRCSGTFSAEDVDFYLREQDAILDGGHRYVVIFDGRDLKSVSAKELRRLADHIKKHSDALGERCAYSSIVLTSAVIRGALKALVWLTPLPMPYVVHATLEEALTATERAALAARLPLPASIAALKSSSAA